jgi:hypothetical protein
MAFTTADLTAIERAIASGELRVKFSDREVEYRSISELLRAKDTIKTALSQAASSTTRCTFISHSKD